MKLEITFTELHNIEYFGCLPELRVLNLCSNKITRIDPLYTYYRLESLNLGTLALTRVQPDRKDLESKSFLQSQVAQP